jgi:hypothetical protein
MVYGAAVVHRRPVDNMWPDELRRRLLAWRTNRKQRFAGQKEWPFNGAAK